MRSSLFFPPSSFAPSLSLLVCCNFSCELIKTLNPFNVLVGVALIVCMIPKKDSASRVVSLDCLAIVGTVIEKVIQFQRQTYRPLVGRDQDSRIRKPELFL